MMTVRQPWILGLVMLCLALFGPLAQAQDVTTIREIEIKGTQNVNKEAILQVMRTKVGQPYLISQLDQDKRAIEDMGFFKAVDVRGREQGGSWIVVVEVIEFPLIKEIRIVGNTAVKTEDILKVLQTAPALPVQAGAIFNLGSIKACSDGIERLYQQKGYFARVESFGPLNEAPEVINVSIVEATVNSVAVQGATRTKASVLNKLVRTRPGGPLNVEMWRNDLRRLYNTQWFESVNSVERPSAEDPSKLDLIADVKEQRTGQFNVGLQVDPRSNFAGFIRFSDSNFRGSGQSAGVSLLQGGEGGLSVDLDYGNPYVDSKGTAFSASIYSRVLFRFTGVGFGSNESPTDDNRFYERRTGTSLSWSKTTHNDTRIFSIGVRYENIKTSDLDTSASSEGFIQQDGDVGAIVISNTWNRRDADIEPSRGDWLRLSIEPGYANITKVGGDISTQSFLGSSTFVKGTIEYRKYWSPQPPREKFDDPRRVVAFRLRAGAISGDVPFFEQFFTGGADSIRGYNDDRYWGRYTASATIEYRHPIQKSFNAILFADYGSAWDGYGSVNDYTQTTKPDFQLGYGIGFSFRSPFGPIRLDIGFRKGGGSKTHFQIGTSF